MRIAARARADIVGGLSSPHASFWHINFPPAIAYGERRTPRCPSLTYQYRMRLHEAVREGLDLRRAPNTTCGKPSARMGSSLHKNTFNVLSGAARGLYAVLVALLSGSEF